MKAALTLMLALLALVGCIHAGPLVTAPTPRVMLGLACFLLTAVTYVAFIRCGEEEVEQRTEE
jgi:hypothetical protein